MKKLIYVILIFSVIFIGCSKKTSAQDVSDYFPVAIGNSWTYANSRDINTHVIIVRNSMPDPNDNGTMVYLFDNLIVGVSTATMYSIKENRVVVLTTRDGFGRYHEYKRPYPVELAAVGQEWRQDEEDEEYYLFKGNL